MRLVIAHFGDRHGGLRNGLIRPGTKLVYTIGSQSEEVELGWEQLSPWSQWLWEEVWLPAVEFGIDLAGADPLLLADGGDAVHGSKHAHTEVLYSPHITHQKEISMEALRPWRKAKHLAGILLAFGTESHDYGANSATLDLAKMLGKWHIKALADHHFRFVLEGGSIFDLAHHGNGVSGRPHLRESAARNSMYDILRLSLDLGQRPPRLIQRGHVHVNVHVPSVHEIGAEEYAMNLIVTPPMCGPNQYGRKASRSAAFIKCGMYFSEWIDGALTRVIPFIRVRDARTTLTTESSGMVFYSNMIKDGGHQKKKKK